MKHELSVLLRTMLLVCAALAATGCAKVPQEQVDAALKSVAGAEQAEAATYAGEEMSDVADAQRRLEAELKLQEEKNRLFRSYDETKKLLAEVEAAAAEATRAATEGKAKARAEARSAIDAAATSLTETQAMLDAAPTGKGAAADLAAMRTDLEAVQSTLNEANAAFGSEAYLDAMAKAQAGDAVTTSVRTAIQAAEEARAAAKQRRR